MHPFSLFFFCVVVAFGVGFMFPFFGFLILATVTLVFPVLWVWVMFKEHFRTGQLLFWLATLSAMNFAVTSGSFLFHDGPLACAAMGGFVLFTAVYVFMLNKTLPRAHISKARVHPRRFQPEDNND